VNAQERKALSDAYFAMVQMDAWEDLERFIVDEREASVRRSDTRSAAEITLAEVGEERGIRKGLDKILKHVMFRKEGI